MGKVVIRILQGSEVTHIMLGGLIIYSPVENFLWFTIFHVPKIKKVGCHSNNKKAVLSRGEPRDATVNFDTYRILQ